MQSTPDETESSEVLSTSAFEQLPTLRRLLEEFDETLTDTHAWRNNFFVNKLLDFFDGIDQAGNSRAPKIALEFSSPNIAKPFHVGHLRSTFIGRALANFLASSGADVVRINYLGDWGTQFGILAAGYETFGDEIRNQRNIDETPISALKEYFNVYVKASAKAEIDPQFRQQALDFFASLENGSDAKARQFWCEVVDKSITDLRRLYHRLDVEFDIWESEQDAAYPAREIIQDIQNRKLLQKNNRGISGLLTSYNNSDRFIPLLKSDGTTLYLTRDISTAIHRIDNLSCDKIIYVTDLTQADHFYQLKAVLEKIGRADVAERITHVKYGRILNMSTRKGQAIFVEDLINEGVRRAEDLVLKPDKNTKTLVNDPERRSIAEQLALSGSIVNDFRKRLSLEYEFDWNCLLETKKDGGVSLQKTFAHLSSICQRCPANSTTVPNSMTLQANLVEPEARKLLNCLTRDLAPALASTKSDLELFPLAQYLFRLRRCSGASLRRLRIIDAPSPELRSSRLLLLDVARRVLGLGIRLLGARPLTKI